MSTDRQQPTDPVRDIRAAADEWLTEAGESGYALGGCAPVEGSWYAVEVEPEQGRAYRVYVRLREEGEEVRDDRVLEALSREMTSLAAASAPSTALCVAWVEFAGGMPLHAWQPTASLEEVGGSEVLSTDWYLLDADAGALAEAAAELALEMAGRGYLGALHVGLVEEGERERLRAGGPDWDALATAAGVWITVDPERPPERAALEEKVLGQLSAG